MDALIRERELDVNTLVGDIMKMPAVNDGLDVLSRGIEAENLADFKIEYEHMKMLDTGHLLYDFDGSQVQMSYTRHALTQAISRIKPDGVIGMAGYLAACPPDLRSVNFNYWHQDTFDQDSDTEIPGNKIMIRLMTSPHNGDIVMRAMVSQLYHPVDDMIILNSMKDIFPAGGRLHAVRGDIKSRYMIFWPTNKITVTNGDEVMMSLRIINSEAAASSVWMQPQVHFAAYNSCMLVPRSGVETQIRHVGEAKRKLSKAFASSQEYLAPFNSALELASQKSVLTDFKDSDTLVRCLGAAFDISKPKLQAIKNEFNKQNRWSILHLAIAMTEAANPMDIASGEELQMKAGELIMRGCASMLRYIDVEE